MRLGSLLSSALVAGLAVGCGGSSSGYPTSGGTTTTTTTGPAAASVAIAEYSFTPDTVTIKVGASVTWTNNGTVGHTATADGGAFDSGQLSSPTMGGAYGGGSTGGTYTLMFGTAGTYAYHCANHPMTMKGTVIVTP